tara:strand:+ start:851 stop:1309 length:459 start_codon:yes stop_codon:yes gene_type:complete
MKYILVLLFFVNFTNAQSDVKDIRKIFLLSSDSQLKCSQLYKISSEKVSICPIYHSYNIVSKILESKYLRNPVKKVKVFKENTKLLDSLLVSHPKILEIRFLRYSIQLNAPKILGYTNSVREDYEFIMKNISLADEDLKKIITSFMSKFKYS